MTMQTLNTPMPQKFCLKLERKVLKIQVNDFVFNDLLHQTLISNNEPWFTFPFMHIRGNPIVLIIPCF